MVVNKGSEQLVAELEVLLKKQTANRNYDRLIYINAFILFKAQNPQLSEEEALARFELRSAEIVEQCMGGHCGGLSGSLLRESDYGPGAYLVGSKLPATFQQEKAPEYCHVAAMIRFQNPDTAEDNGLILLEPGFNISSGGASGESKNRRSLDAITGFRTGRPDSSSLVSVPRPLSAISIEPSGCRTTAQPGSPVCSASSAT